MSKIESKQNITSQLKTKLAKHYSNNLYRSRLLNIQNSTIHHRNKINFASNNYLGLTHNEFIIKKIQDLLPNIGLGSSASSLITGIHSIHQDLENLITEILNTDQTILFPSGFMANLAILDLLTNLDNTVILQDHNNHASLIDGCKMSLVDFTQPVILTEEPGSSKMDSGSIHFALTTEGAYPNDKSQTSCVSSAKQPRHKLNRYKHLDLNHLRVLLEKFNNYNKLIITETLFSMDGDFINLSGLIGLLNSYNNNQTNSNLLILDESHAFGLFGKNNGGLNTIANIDKKNTLIMGTFGKAIGSAGAFVSGPKVLIESLIQFARPYIYTTSLSPVAAAASYYSIKYNIANSAHRDKLFENIAYFHKNYKLTTHSVNSIEKVHGLSSPIIPIVLSDSKKTIKAAEYLNKHGIIATAIRAPTVPENKARLRITLSSEHSFDDIDYLIKHLHVLADTFTDDQVA